MGQMALLIDQCRHIPTNYKSYGILSPFALRSGDTEFSDAFRGEDGPAENNRFVTAVLLLISDREVAG